MPTDTTLTATMLTREFDRQVENLLDKGYPEAAGVTAEAFRAQLEPLAEKVREIEVAANDPDQGRLSFVIVIKSELVPAAKAMSLVERNGQRGVTKLFPREPEDFGVIDGLELPNGAAYLLADIDRGKDSLNMTPNDALVKIEAEGRSPLTIAEGIAIVTHFPGFLMKNNCFSLLASRNQSDQRVPAIWINGAKQPNLGWCWAGNPHTWLGSASCGRRIGA